MAALGGGEGGSDVLARNLDVQGLGLYNLMRL
jgi:hypothetical protein